MMNGETSTKKEKERKRKKDDNKFAYEKTTERQRMKNTSLVSKLSLDIHSFMISLENGTTDKNQTCCQKDEWT